MLEVPTNIESQLKYYTALYRLTKLEAEFKYVISAFTDTEKALNAANRDERDIVSVHQRQGALQLISEFFRHIRESEAMVNKIEGRV